MRPRRRTGLAVVVLLFAALQPRVAPQSPGFPFSIVGDGFELGGEPVFLHMLAYQPIEPGQSNTSDAIRLPRIQDDLRRLRAFRGGSEPVIFRLYEQPTAAMPQRFPQAFYDGLRQHGFYAVRDIYFDANFAAPDAISKGQAAIDRAIAELDAADAFDRIFAWEIGNEFQAGGAMIPVLQNFLAAMRNHIKARMAEPGREGFSNWVTWASWPPSDPLRTDSGSPISVSLDYVSFNAYSYEPETIRHHQAGPGTGTPFAGYLAALKSRFPGIPLVLTETGLSDSVATVAENDHNRIPPLYPSYRKGALSPAQVSEGLADRYWDARLSGAVAGVQIFQWADGWYKTGDPSTKSTHPEESFGLCGFVTAPVIQLRCKLQYSVIQGLFSMRLPGAAPLLTGVVADATLLAPHGTTTVRAQLAPGASPVRYRWESTRGRVVGEGPIVQFHAGTRALGPAIVTVVAIDANGDATPASEVIDIQAGAPSIELLSFGSTVSSGRVNNVDLATHKVVLYVQTNQLYVQPFTDMKSIWVTGRGFFRTPSHASAADSPTLRAWVVPIGGGEPPSTLPVGSNPPGWIATAFLAAINDTDNDLLPDALELNPAGEDRYSDPDGDGALNLEELLRGTNMHVADNDSDGDGLKDDWEERFFATLAYNESTDPDGDGLTNAAEMGAGTHPGRIHVDRDADGLPDSFELRVVGSLAQGPLDTNSGGVTNRDAYELGIQSPTVSSIANQTTTMGTAVGPLAFTLGDDGPLGALLVSPSSSNETLVPASGIAIGGSGAGRTVTVTPAAGQLGSALITLLVIDGEGGATARSFTLTVVAVSAGNLRVSALKASAAAASGGPFSITTTTINAGPGNVPATRTGLWLSTDKALDGDTLLGNADVPALVAGAKKQIVSNVALPGVAPGQYYLIAQADKDGQAAEPDEGDNTRVRALLIGPDLTPEMTLMPSSPVSSAPTTISVTTTNGGGQAAAVSVSRLYRSTKSKVDATAVLLAAFPVPALPPNGSAVNAVAVTLPAGTYYLLAVADATAVVAEAKESNNLKKVKETVP